MDENLDWWMVRISKTDNFKSFRMSDIENCVKDQIGDS